MKDSVTWPILNISQNLMFKHIAKLSIVLGSILLGNGIHEDRILIYVENSFSDFALDNKIPFPNTTDQQINNILLKTDALKIRKWLPSARVTDRDGDIYLNRFFVVHFKHSRSDLFSLIDIYNSLKNIRFSDTISKMRKDYDPNDPRYYQQWHLPQIEAPQAFDAWDIGGGEIPGTNSTRQIVVAAVDDGFEWDHPDLINNIWNNLGEDADGDGHTLEQSGSNWILDPGDINNIDDDNDGFIDNLIGWDVEADGGGAEDNNPMTVSGNDHGTMVAGCMSAVTNNGLGVASVGWSLKIMPIKATATPNSQYIEDGYNGILTAAQQGADVINCSWGGFSGGGSQSLINTVWNTYNAIVVASSGNGNEDVGYSNFDNHYPSAYNNVISVSATGPGDTWGSSWFHPTAGPTVDICAPGENIWTTDTNNGYDNPWGTSFSSPITAGAIGLLWSLFPNESKQWIVDKITSTADYFPAMNGYALIQNYSDDAPHQESLNGMLGSGRLNINKAINGGLFPSLIINEVHMLNDTDGDGVFNPGETVNVKLVLYNEEQWAEATNITCVLSTDNPWISIIDNLIEISSPIESGSSTFALFDAFTITSDLSAPLGPVNLNVTITAGSDPYIYETIEEISIMLSINQMNFPFFTLMGVKTSPIVYDMNSDGEQEVYFGSDNYNFYGLGSNALLLSGFPFTAGNQVRSSPAIGDVDNDNEPELVFGSKDQNLYILNGYGSIELVFSSSGYINHAPALTDLDGDGDLEIIFGTFEYVGGSNTGFLYAIHHDGSIVNGFPIDLGSPIMVEQAIGDIDGDGELDIIVGTWGNKITAISSSGTIKSGFPFSASNKINVPPSIGNLIGDSNLEIAAGSDDGNLYIINSIGSAIDIINTGGFVRGDIALHDFNTDGYPEVVFAGYDKEIHVYNVSNGSEISGWPVNVNSNIISSPIIADLDNDGSVEILAGHINNQIVAYHSNGIQVETFPVTTASAIQSSLGIEDMDQDGDLEILVGTSQGLEVIDVKTNKGSPYTWSVFRGSYHRTGLYSDALMNNSLQKSDKIIPSVFSVSDNYPNPFNPRTQFTVSLPKMSHIVVTIYDISGRQVALLAEGDYNAGQYRMEWDGMMGMNAAAPSGVYLLVVQAGDHVFKNKMIMMK